jgi:DNA helicase HerA-like ATPase
LFAEESEFVADPLLIAKGETDQYLLPKMANRHGLVAGATGTGKTVTIHAMAEQFSRIGVPVFMADVKGDLAGISQAGGDNERVTGRVSELGLADFTYEPSPVIFWDLYGKLGHPVRATVSEIGPLLLSRLLDLSDAQAGVLQLVFRYADDNGLLILDLNDLRSMLRWVGDNRDSVQTAYGNVAPQSVGAIQRSLLTLEEAGGSQLFGEPAISLADFLRTDGDGRGYINILASEQLINSPLLYASFLLWLLSELFETLPEVGDPEKPKLVFFFDEAHLLFTDCPEALQDKIEQVIRLIRSKGVGVYFISQNPLDVPDIVLGQLGNRVQHALRAFTRRDQKAVRSAAETFRPNPRFKVEQVISELGTGEALTSFLDENGAPGVVERALIIPPRSRIGVITPAERAKIVNWSPLQGLYEQVIDRESAYEMLKARAEQAAAAAAAAKDEQARAERAEKSREREERGTRRTRRRVSPQDTTLEAATRSAARAAGTSLGRAIVRGILGSLTGRSR